MILFLLSLRIVSLNPAVTQLLLLLGAEDSICGAVLPVDSVLYNKIVICGNFAFPNIEKIVSLRPDLIFTAGGIQENIAYELRKMGFKVYIYYPENFNEILKNIEKIGKIVGTEDRAKFVCDSLSKEAKKIRKFCKRFKRKKIFFEIWSEPLITAGRKSFLTGLCDIINCENIFSEVNSDYFQVSPERVILRKPDYIIVLHEGISPLKNYGFHIIRINPDLLLKPNHLVLKGLNEIVKKIYLDGL